MDEIKKLLERSGLLSLKDSGLTIVSIYGVSEEKKTNTSSDTALTLANRIVGKQAFAARNEPITEKTLELADGLQMYVDHNSKIVYIFMDSNLKTTSLATDKSFSTSMMNHQSSSMRGLLFMLTISHLVIPILPPSILPTDFLSTLVALGQVKSNWYTHLAQYQSSCWKHWGINVPNALFEKKELERINPNLLGWWGPAKGVPILVFVAANIPFPTIVPATIKKMQETLQAKTKNMFRALHLVPLKPDGNTPILPIEVRSLFLLPSGSQLIIHIVPAAPKEVVEKEARSPYTFGQPMSISSYLNGLTVTEPSSSPSTLYNDYSNKLLRNFVANWTKTATNRHPLHSSGNTSASGGSGGGFNSNNRKEINKGSTLPTAMQFVSAVVPLLYFIFNQPITENGVDFKKVITSDFPSTKGMIQQIEVILRKKIKDNIEIERVFSKSHSMNLMEKCTEAYLQDSPPFYTEQYHTWKKSNVMRMYRSLARGPCMEEYATKLERECDHVWKQGRQSCEHVSLTGKACRLKIGHGNEAPQQKSSRDDRAIIVDTSKHNSGFSFFHACDCGRTQKIRDDPFDIKEANVKFYNKFNCCLGTDRAALDIKESTYGESQNLVLNCDEIPPYDSALLYLGPASIYKNNVGLDKVEGFMNNANFLIPWSITTVNELKVRQQEAMAATASATINDGPILDAKPSNDTSAKNTFLRSTSAVSKVKDDTTEWPMLGQNTTVAKSTVNTAPAPIVASLEAFPALGSNSIPAATTTSTALNQSSALSSPTTNGSSKQLFDTRRRRHHRMRDRLQGLIRGYVGAEYECPHGHRFLSCGEGRVCKLGHVGHPKEHGNYFVHQDLPIFVVCPCTYANNPTNANPLEVTAQLQRLYITTPDEALTISIEPKVKINVPGSDEPLILDLGINDTLDLGPSGAYVLRLPFIYRDSNGSPIPVETDVQKRLKSAILLKDCIKFHYKETERWKIAI